MPPEMPSQPLSFLDGLIVLLFIGGSLLIGYFLSRRARHSTDEYFRQHGVVHVGDFHGGDSFCCGYSTGLDRMGGDQGLVSKLVLVVHGPHHHAGGLLLCPAVEAGQPSDRYGTGLPALLGSAMPVGKALWWPSHSAASTWGGSTSDDGDHQLHHPGVSTLALGRSLMLWLVVATLYPVRWIPSFEKRFSRGNSNPWKSTTYSPANRLSGQRINRCVWKQ